MKNIVKTTNFKQNIKKLQKQNKEIDKLKIVIELLANGEKLDFCYREHQLLGQIKSIKDKKRYKHILECHIEPDWLLVYENNKDTLTLIASGSHSELFSRNNSFLLISLYKFN